MKDRYLFKAKEKNWKELPEDNRWVVGYLVKYPTGEWKIERECDNPPDGDPMWRRVNIIYEVDPSTICQCTGLKDKNGKLIWENDIVRTSSSVRGVIRFGRYGDTKTDYGFYVEWEKSQPYWRNDIYYWQSKLRVVGSVVDNSELLEVEE